MRTRPDELCDAFRDGVQGKADINIAAVVDAIVLDIIDSAGLAVESSMREQGTTPTFAQGVRRQVEQTIKDYYGNNYGEL